MNNNNRYGISFIWAIIRITSFKRLMNRINESIVLRLIWNSSFMLIMHNESFHAVYVSLTLHHSKSEYKIVNSHGIANIIAMQLSRNTIVRVNPENCHVICMYDSTQTECIIWPCRHRNAKNSYRVLIAAIGNPSNSGYPD